MDDEENNDNVNNLRFIKGKKGSKIKKTKKTLIQKQESVVKDVKEYLAKPMHETTIGDQLILSTCTIVISIVVSISAQGWLALIRDVATNASRKRG